MSGITPILDTLLHQVLGKRVDTQPPRELLEPVKPLTPGVAPRAIQGDAQLDARHGDAIGARAGQEVGKALGRSVLSTPTPSTSMSTTTHFSPAARTIADILVKFPAPPSVIQPAAPLLSQRDGVASPPLLAAHLQNSIESSGLFYESHLARWYRGDVPKAMLQREPQMLRFQPLPNGKATGQESAGLRSDATSAGRSTLGASASPSTTAVGSVSAPQVSGVGSALTASPAATLANGGVPAGGDGIPFASGAGVSSGALQPTSAETIDDTLQGIVRHQLELLVTPTLRWEGNIWSGIFMALSIQFPETLDERSGNGDGGRDPAGDDESLWHTQLNLQLPSLGALTVQMHLRDASMSLTLQSGHQGALEVLKQGHADLAERLRRCGYEDVRINVVPIRNDEMEREP